MPATSRAVFEETLRPAASGERLVVDAGNRRLMEVSRGEARELFCRRFDGLVAESKGRRLAKPPAGSRGGPAPGPARRREGDGPGGPRPRGSAGGSRRVLPGEDP